MNISTKQQERIARLTELTRNEPQSTSSLCWAMGLSDTMVLKYLHGSDAFTRLTKQGARGFYWASGRVPPGWDAEATEPCPSFQRPRGAIPDAYRPGTTHGRWTVLIEAPRQTRSKARESRVRLLCRCVCGHQQPVWLGDLQRGRSKGCRSRSCRVAYERGVS